MPEPRPQTLSFGAFTIDPARGCLRRDGADIKLRPKSFEVLHFLVENPGRLVSKEEILQAVWTDAAVTDNSLVQCLIEIRRALCDDSQTIIKTVPRRGYIFDIAVTALDSHEEAIGGIQEPRSGLLEIEQNHNHRNTSLSEEQPLTASGPADNFPASSHTSMPSTQSDYLSIKLLAGVALLVLTAVTAWKLLHRDVPSKFTLSRLTSDSGLTTDAAISSDGSLIAYASDRDGKGDLDIWVQQMAGREPVPLTKTPEDDHEPSFSPDGATIVFRSERNPAGIYTVSTLGGDAKLIARDGQDPHFSPDGKWIAYWTGTPGDDRLPPQGNIYMIPADGGPARRLCVDFPSATFPVWSPNGNQILFEGSRDSPREQNWILDWWIISVADGKISKTGASDVIARQQLRLYPRRRTVAWTGNKLVFAATSGDSTNLWQLSLDGNHLQRLTQGSGTEVGPSIAANGAIVFSSVVTTTDIWSLRLGADQAGTANGMQRITEAAAQTFNPSISADGTKLAYLSNKALGPSIWIRDLQDGKETFITRTRNPPRLSHDGTMLALIEDQSIVVMPSSGGEATRVCADCQGAWDWSPDNTRILYPAGSPSAVGELTIASGAKRTALKDSKYGIAAPRFSPDGHWVVFHTTRGPTQRQLFIARYPSESDWIPLTDGTGLDRNGVWSPDGNLIYYLSERDGFRCIWAQRLDAVSKKPSGSAFPVAHFHSTRHSLFPLTNVGQIGLTVAPGRLVFSLAELSGNVWVAKPENQTQ